MNYIKHKENPTSFKKGFVPWNKGTKGLIKPNKGSFQKGEHRSRQTEFRKGNTLGEKNIKWKGDFVGYGNLHAWVKRHRGKAIWCTWCCSTIRIEWANLSHEYKRDLGDWIQLCRKCHFKYDSGKNWRSSRKYFKGDRRASI